MLNIRQIKHLARALDVNFAVLGDILKNAEEYYETLILIDPSKLTKQREVVNVRGNLRAVQSRLYRRVLLPKLLPSEFSHGGVRGRSIKSNASPHKDGRYLLTTDIENFYPSVHRSRIYSLFIRLGCSPDVARVCTRLCTYRHKLALGLITSPILADCLLKQVDTRIALACQKEGLTYTRFVDDITISGPFSFEKSGFRSLVRQILAEHGFATKLEKTKATRIEDSAITGVRIAEGKLDVRRDYIIEFERQLSDAASLGRDGDFAGPYFTRDQLKGRCQFIVWVNPRRRRSLINKFRSVRWRAAERIATRRGFVASKKILKKKDGESDSRSL